MEGYLQKRGVRLAFLVLIVLGSLVGIYLLRGIFAPLILAFFIAYILDPLADKLEARRLSRLTAVIIIFSSVTIVLVAAGTVVGVYAVRGAVSTYVTLAGDKPTEKFDEDLPRDELEPGVHYMDRNENGQYDKNVLEKLSERGQDFLDTLPSWVEEGVNQWVEKRQAESESLSNADRVESVLDRLWAYGEMRVRQRLGIPKGPSSDPDDSKNEADSDDPKRTSETETSDQVEVKVSGLPGATPREVEVKVSPESESNDDSLTFFLFSYLLLCPLYVFFFLLQIDPMVATVRRYLPAAQKDRIVRISTQIDRILSAFFRGRLIVCLVKGIVTAVGLFILDVPFWLPLGFSAGFLSLIPYIGVYVSLIPAVLLSWFEHESYGQVIGILAWYGAMEAVEGFVLIPKFLGKEVGLHPLTIVVTLVIFGKLFGFFGVLLSVPLAAVTKILAQEFILPVIVEFAESDPDDEPPTPETTSA